MTHTDLQSVYYCMRDMKRRADCVPRKIRFKKFSYLYRFVSVSGYEYAFDSAARFWSPVVSLVSTAWRRIVDIGGTWRCANIYRAVKMADASRTSQTVHGRDPDSESRRMTFEVSKHYASLSYKPYYRIAWLLLLCYCAIYIVNVATTLQKWLSVSMLASRWTSKPIRPAIAVMVHLFICFMKIHLMNM